MVGNAQLDNNSAGAVVELTSVGGTLIAVASPKLRSVIIGEMPFGLYLKSGEVSGAQVSVARRGPAWLSVTRRRHGTQKGPAAEPG
jgi:hypothetical protein